MPKNPKPKNNFLEKLFRTLIYLAPAILFFSYFPNFSLGASSSMNFEFSLPIIWLVLFDFLGFLLLLKNHLFKNLFKNWPWLLFPSFLTLSIFWSPNSLRGILVAGILWLIYFAGFSLLQLKSIFKKDTKTIFYRVFFYSALAVCAWCFIQSILDTFGVSKEITLMCAGCGYDMFGFPHPSGFAIEPQFMGNLLLAPCLVAIWLIISSKQNGKNFKHGHEDLARVTRELLPAGHVASLFLFFFSLTLFFTFSRGAIYAFGVATIFLLALTIVKQKSARPLKILPVIILSFLFALNFQGLFAEFGPTNETYFGAIAKSLNHLSLGIIDVRPAKPVEDANPTETTSPEQIESTQSPESTQPLESADPTKLTEEPAAESARFDGYVESSTATRVELNHAAVRIWQKTPTSIFLGVGLGGAGQALYANGETGSPKEIIQNQFFSLLLETGLIGTSLAIFTLILIIKSISKTNVASLIYTLMLAYGVSLMFFAGLPNALHIYLLPIILLVIGKMQYRKS